MSVSFVQLHDIANVRVGTVRDALKNVNLGTGIVYTFSHPSALYCGTIPRNCTVIWRKPGEEELHLMRYGWTYFTWFQTVEIVVVTGLVKYTFAYDKMNITLSFSIFDPLKFCSTLEPEALKDKLQNSLFENFKDYMGKNLSSTSFLQHQAKVFLSINRTFQQFGVTISEIKCLPE